MMLTAVNPAAPEHDAPPAARRSWARFLGRWFERGLAFFAWGGLLTVLGTVLLAEVLPEDFNNVSWPYRWLVAVVFGFHALQVHVGMACVAAAVVGAALRRRWLALTGVALAGVLLSAELQNVTRWPRLDRPAGETIRVMSANLYFKNKDMSSILHSIDAANADVLLFQEVTPFHAELFETYLKEKYPHRLVEAVDISGGVAVLSRRPFELAGGTEVVSRTGNRKLRQVIVQIDGREVAIHAIHLASPGSPRAIAWNRQQTAMLLEAAKARTLPTIMAGDFNFTERNAQHQAFEAIGMTSAYTQAGMARMETWRPGRNRFRFIPGVRIDHAFLSPELTVTHLASGQWTGSDHRPIIFEVGFRAE